MKISHTLTDYMYNFIEEICEKFGPRYSCSEQEKQANKWIKTEFKNYCDEVKIDEFQTKPALYPQGLVKVAGILSGISPIFMPLYFPLPIITSIFIFLGLFVLITELIFMKEWIGFLFRKKTSSNVFGKIKPANETKFRIIIEGHTDSAKVMNIASINEISRLIIGFLGISFLVMSIIFSIWKFTALIILGEQIILINWFIISLTLLDVVYFLFLIFLYPFFLLLVKGFLGKDVVLGANDNLAGTAVAAGIGKYLNENRLKNIEVWICSQGSEEVGDKGARAFVEKYGELGYLNNAYNLILECCGAAEAILLVEKDMHGIIYDEEMNQELVSVYEDLKKNDEIMLNLRIDRLKIGACDVVRYIENGYKATALFGVEKTKNKAVNWHSKEDIPENIEKVVLRDFLVLSLKFIQKIDLKYS